jgi:phosphoglycerate kinase
MDTFNTLEKFNFNGKKVIIRVDFNVSIDDDGNITNDNKIRAALPTIQEVMKGGAKQIVLMSHLGRPKEKEHQFRMDRVAARLQELSGETVAKVDDCIDVELPDAPIVMLENLRFHREEKDNDPTFAKKLSKYGDYYVNDAFGTAHRAHASVYGITKFIPSCAGLLFQKEVEVLSGALLEPKRPLVAIVGAAKVSSKITVLNSLLEKVDKLLIGGAIVFTFLKSIDFKVGASLVEDDYLNTASDILIAHKEKIIFPKDFVCCQDPNGNGEVKTFNWDDLDGNWMGLDVGERSINDFKEILKGAGTIIWNGPLGKFEIDAFGAATKEIGEYITQTDAFTIAAGGDTASAIEKYGLQDSISHISTGGGASLEFLEGKTLPAVQALYDNKKKFMGESSFK